jgi:uncharacterized protein (TIGR03118 family)
MAKFFEETDLVSDGFVPADHFDPNLVNPWGVSYSPTGPFWVSNAGTGVSTLYDGNGVPQRVLGYSAIGIAATPGQDDPTEPTGQVFNTAGTGFEISKGSSRGSSVFIFATANGTISGWNPGVDDEDSILAINHSPAGAVYTGLAIGEQDGDQFLFAANFGQGRVEVYDENFDRVKNFTDPNIPDGYAPFNVQVLGNHLFVAYAKADDEGEEVPGKGKGFVDEFNLKGEFIDRVASHGPLNAPWGLAIAPAGFGKFSHDLLVGNFGNGTINVYDHNTHEFLGKLRDQQGDPIRVEGLWALIPGNDGPNSDPHKIYFTAGIDDEEHGLFGSLGGHQSNHLGPDPGSYDHMFFA